MCMAGISSAFVIDYTSLRQYTDLHVFLDHLMHACMDFTSSIYLDAVGMANTVLPEAWHQLPGAGGWCQWQMASRLW